MKLRAWCAAGLLTAAAGAQEAPQVEGTAIVQQAIEASFAPGSTGGVAPVVRWDGRPVSQDDDIEGMRGTARDTIETWRRFAERRGYRVDLDESQRVVVISETDRFGSFASSERIIEKTLRRLESFEGLAEPPPIVLLRAKDADDAFDASEGAMVLGVDHGLTVFEETGTLRDVRSVDARLAEGIVRGYLAEHQPFLSEWMTDGLASLLAEDVTGRAIVDGEAVSLRSLRYDVASATRQSSRESVDLLRLSGARNDGIVLEAEAMALLSFLDEAVLETLVSELGQRDVPASTAKVTVEEEALMAHLGKNVLSDLQRSLKKGR